MKALISYCSARGWYTFTVTWGRSSYRCFPNDSRLFRGNNMIEKVYFGCFDGVSYDSLTAFR
jgi:hypothetical protein